MLKGRSVGDGQVRCYRVPDGLTMPQGFDHWRAWYGSAVETPMRLERIGPAGTAFNPTAASFAADGFSLIEVSNEPAAGYWNGNPDSNDVRLAYFRQAPSVTLLAPDPWPIASGYVGFLDVAHKGAFTAPAGLHAFQVNMDRSRLGIDDRSYAHLLRMRNLSGHPLVKSFVIPSLLNWKHSDVAREAEGVATIFTSLMTSLVSSLLGAPADAEALKPGRLLAIRKYLEANYRDKDLGADRVAAQFNISRRSLFYVFETEPLQFGAHIRTLRTVKALELLTDSRSVQLPLAEIADASGFSGLQAMRRALRETTGLTAREAREHSALARQSIIRLRGSLSP